ncbi:MAG: DUF309 domain-containing protein [Halobacteriales archaeon]
MNYDEAIDRGAVSFDAGEYYEAHEVWEEAWLEAEGRDRLLLQALVQTAAAYVQHERGERRAVASLSASAQDYLDGLPRSYLGVDVERLRDVLRETNERARTSIDSDGWTPLMLRHVDVPRAGEAD